MKFIISGKNIDVTPGLKAAVEDKIGKLEKYLQRRGLRRNINIFRIIMRRIRRFLGGWSVNMR